MSFQITLLQPVDAGKYKVIDFKDGKIIKTLNNGDHKFSFNVEAYDDLYAFKQTLEEATPGEGILLSIPKDNLTSGAVLSSNFVDAFKKYDNVIATTKEYFDWVQGAGVFMLDFDGLADNNQVKDIPKIMAPVFKACPMLENYQYVTATSSSSMIYKDGRMVSGVTGLHAYFIIDKARDTKIFGDILFDRLALVGHSKIEISKSGGMLQRSAVDSAIWQPTRLDFIGGAVMASEGLVQRRDVQIWNQSKPMIVETDLVFKELSSKEKKDVASIWERMRSDKYDQAIDKREAWIAAHPVENREAARHLSENKTLVPGFMLETSKGERVDVADILADPAKYHGGGFIDPVTGEVGKSQIRYDRKTGRVILNCFDQGGVVYTLSTGKTVINAKKDGSNIDEILQVLGDSGNWFAFNGMIAEIVNNEIVTYVERYSGEVARFTHRVKELFEFRVGDNIVAPSSKLMHDVIATSSFYLRVIDRVSNIPGIDRKNEEVYGWEAGYHEPTKTYFTKTHDRASFKSIETLEDAMKYAEKALSAFRLYKFRSEAGRARLMASVFTCALRSAFPLAPGIVIHTPKGGNSSGKTPMQRGLVKCFTDNISTYEYKGEDKLGDYLFDQLRRNRPIVLDNLPEGKVFSSNSLAVLFSSDVWSDRKKSVSENHDLPAMVPVVMSGNVYSPDKDMSIRLMEIDIDSDHKVLSDWLPEEEVDRDEIVAIAFGLIEWMWKRIDHKAKFKEIFEASKENKFSDWDRTIRVLVYILTGVDPMAASYARYAVGADIIEDYGFAMALRKFYGNTKTGVKEFIYNEFEADIDARDLDDLAREYGVTRVGFHRKFTQLARQIGVNSGCVYGTLVLKVISKTSGRTRYALEELESPTGLNPIESRKAKMKSLNT